MNQQLINSVPADLYIGGEWREASDGGRFDVLNPADEEVLASVASATIEDAIAALDAAEAAFAGWAGCGGWAGCADTAAGSVGRSTLAPLSTGGSVSLSTITATTASTMTATAEMMIGFRFKLESSASASATLVWAVM